MNPIINHRLTLASAFVRQHEQQVQKEISARYAFEMATRLDPQNREMLNKARAQMQAAELERLTMEQMVEAVTELSVEQLRAAENALEVVLGRQIEVENELLKIQLLVPVFEEAVMKYPETPGAEEARKNIEGRRAELALIEEHYARLTALAESVAEKIKYHDISEVTVIQPRLVLP